MRSERGLNVDETKGLFAPLEGAAGVVVAVSGGADSIALLVLCADWAKSAGVPIYAATVDHGLRLGAAAEATAVGVLAKRLGITHRILVWKGDKPKTGIQEAARAARYALLDGAAQRFGASHLATAHTRDDQAETVLMRLAAGSGPGGLAGMRERVRRDRLVHVRPFLHVPKARLVASLRERAIAWAEDESNTDPRFARPRLRAARAALEQEGLTDARLGVLATRMARLSDAAERIAAAAWPDVAHCDNGRTVLDGDALRALPEEIALRILNRAVQGQGDQPPDRLAKSEDLLATVLAALAANGHAGRTLAGAKIAVKAGQVVVTAAPPRRTR